MEWKTHKNAAQLVGFILEFIDLPNVVFTFLLIDLGSGVGWSTINDRFALSAPAHIL